MLVEEFKSICAETGMNFEEMRLVFDGKDLLYRLSFAYFSINTCSTLELIPRVKDGRAEQIKVLTDENVLSVTFTSSENYTFDSKRFANNP